MALSEMRGGKNSKLETNLIEMAQEFTIAFSDRVGAALKRAAKENECTVPALLKCWFFAAGESPTGINIKLHLPPPPKVDTPLFDGVDTLVIGGEGKPGDDE
jgi:hypothetical protein